MLLLLKCSYTLNNKWKTSGHNKVNILMKSLSGSQPGRMAGVAQAKALLQRLWKLREKIHCERGTSLTEHALLPKKIECWRKTVVPGMSVPSQLGGRFAPLGERAIGVK